MQATTWLRIDPVQYSAVIMYLESAVKAPGSETYYVLAMLLNLFVYSSVK